MPAPRSVLLGRMELILLNFLCVPSPVIAYLTNYIFVWLGRITCLVHAFIHTCCHPRDKIQRIYGFWVMNEDHVFHPGSPSQSHSSSLFTFLWHVTMELLAANPPLHATHRMGFELAENGRIHRISCHSIILWSLLLPLQQFIIMVGIFCTQTKKNRVVVGDSFLSSE